MTQHQIYELSTSKASVVRVNMDTEERDYVSVHKMEMLLAGKINYLAFKAFEVKEKESST